MKLVLRILVAALFVVSTIVLVKAQGGAANQTLARSWNEVLLASIRRDFARPTIHARNLYHTGIVLHDAWVVFEDPSRTVLLGKTLGTYTASLEAFPAPSDVRAAQHEAMSYAAYRLLRYRFSQSPNRGEVWGRLDSIMIARGYNPRFIGTDYQTTSNPAALGNYLGLQMVNFGNTDGSNDANGYALQYYEPVNPPLTVNEFGNPDVIDIDRWQPLRLATFIDQSGNVIPGSQQEFLGAEWGDVIPFALSQSDKTVLTRDNHSWNVYHDPGPPPLMKDPATREFMQRSNEMVARWSGLLDPADPTTIDISPGATGIYADPLPTREGYFDYYNERQGGDSTGGLVLNPITGAPYEPNIVNRADYYRVLAEFWADGPASETPPGHWFSILNHVLDQPEISFKWRGQGPELARELYEIQAYLTLGGAMHDAAITAWSIKGFYDASRPVSIIRYMAEKGQRSDLNLPKYSEEGLILEPGFCEFITSISDPLAGSQGEYIGELKIWAWRAHDAIEDPSTDYAGVGWIRAKEWWPYQLRTFVSPPFAGYISGHSTFSRAAAEIMTSMTGSEYFPGGLGSFSAEKDYFLHFEAGPTDTITLTWATYRGASDEVSLSRIYGGIHPPYDDIPGRRIGIEIAEDAFAKANSLFDNAAPTLALAAATKPELNSVYLGIQDTLSIYLSFSETIERESFAWTFPTDFDADALEVVLQEWLPDGRYRIQLRSISPSYEYLGVYLNLSGTDLYNNPLQTSRTDELFEFKLTPVGVAQLPSGARVTLHPNPTNSYFSFLVDGEVNLEASVEVFDVAGRRVHTWGVSDASGQQFDVAQLADGYYLVVLKTDKGLRLTWPLIKGS